MLADSYGGVRRREVESQEYEEIIDEMLRVADSIRFHQQVLAGINNQLQNRASEPIEEDFIHRARYGSFPFEPSRRRVNGVEIEIRELHREGARLTDLVGGDLLYEIVGEKYAIVQFKKAARGSYSIRCDSRQLKELKGNCPLVCYSKRLKKPPIPLRMNGLCGCYYRAQAGSEARYLPVCEAITMFDGNTSAPFGKFASGLSEQTFEELFANCRIGALVRTKAPDDYVALLLQQDHFVLRFSQHGRWPA